MPDCRTDGRLAINTAVRGRKRFEFLQSRVKKAHAAAKRPALDMVVRGGELDQTLEEQLPGTGGGEPEPLPRLVRFPEFVGVEEGDPFLQRAQSDARVPFFSASQIADVKSIVEPVPPMSRVRDSGPMASTFVIASWMRLAGPSSPM